MADNIKWTEAEVKYLLSLAHNYPFNLRECFRIFQQQYPSRSLPSISDKYYYEMRKGNPKKHKIFILIGKRSYSDYRKVIRNKQVHPKHSKPNFFEVIWQLLTGK